MVNSVIFAELMTELGLQKIHSHPLYKGVFLKYQMENSQISRLIIYTLDYN